MVYLDTPVVTGAIRDTKQVSRDLTPFIGATAEKDDGPDAHIAQGTSDLRQTTSGNHAAVEHPGCGKSLSGPDGILPKVREELPTPNSCESESAASTPSPAESEAAPMTKDLRHLAAESNAQWPKGQGHMNEHVPDTNINHGQCANELYSGGRSSVAARAFVATRAMPAPAAAESEDQAAAAQVQEVETTQYS